MSASEYFVEQLTLAPNLQTMSMRKFLKWVWIPAIAGAILCGCEERADVEHPVTYVSNGVEFQYPKNWKVTEDEKSGDVRHIFVESPGSAIFLVFIVPKENSETLDEYADTYSKNIALTKSIAKIGKPTRTTTDDAEGVISEEFSVRLASIEVPHVRRYRLVSSVRQVAYLISQTAKEDLESAAPGFGLLTKSFLIHDQP